MALFPCMRPQHQAFKSPGAFKFGLQCVSASPAALLRPQSSPLFDDEHPARRDRARLFDSERFKRKFATALDDLRGEPGFRIIG